MTSKDRDTRQTSAAVDARDGARMTRSALPAPLDDALHLLQADPGHSLADPGLARLTPVGLDRLFLAARRQAQRNHDGILLLLDLMQLTRNADGIAQHRLIRRLVRQLRHHVEDKRRWQALADNAAYYRDNPRVTECIAARLRLD